MILAEPLSERQVMDLHTAYHELEERLTREQKAYSRLKDKAEARMAELEANHGKGKCVPGDEFEKAKEPIYAEGMRAGCEELMREAARMDDRIAELEADRESLTRMNDWRGTRISDLLAALRAYVEAHETHRPWCNGGYSEGGSCTCDLAERITAAAHQGEGT